MTYVLPRACRLLALLPLAACLAEPEDELGTTTAELNGDTWATADNYGTSPYDAANGIAVSPTTGRIFVVGYTQANNGSWLIRTSDDGVTFTTNSTFQLAAGQYASASAVAIDGVGRIFVTGTARDGGGTYYRWITRRSSDNGATWQTVDNTTPTSGMHTVAWPTSIAIDASGDIYVGGGFGRTGQRGWWAVRRGVNHGASWFTVDSSIGSHIAQVGQPTLNYTPHGMCVANGKVFAVGYDTNAASTSTKWIVRAATPTSAWSQVDIDTTAESAAAGCGGSATEVYITGVVPSGGVAYARTKRSTTGGTSWTTVENTANAVGLAVGFGAGGILYRAGTTTTTGISTWRTRRSPDQGATWIDSDDFGLAAGYSSRPNALAFAAGTNKLYVAGEAWDSAGDHSIVRRLP